MDGRVARWIVRYGRDPTVRYYLYYRVRANSRRCCSLARSLARERALYVYVYIRSAKPCNTRNECAILIRRVKGTLREERARRLHSACVWLARVTSSRMQRTRLLRSDAAVASRRVASCAAFKRALLAVEAPPETRRERGEGEGRAT